MKWLRFGLIRLLICQYLHPVGLIVQKSIRQPRCHCNPILKRHDSLRPESDIMLFHQLLQIFVLLALVLVVVNFFNICLVTFYSIFYQFLSNITLNVSKCIIKVIWIRLYLLIKVFDAGTEATKLL